MTLDALYGDLFDPTKVYLNEFEATVPLGSMCCGYQDCDAFVSLISSLPTKGPAQNLLCGGLTFLWLVDEAGELRLGIEEAVSRSDNSVSVPLAGGLKRVLKESDWEPQGHPAMVSARSARIGGELFYDDSVNPAGWLLNSKSGRYGANLGRTVEHLENAARFFVKLGLDVTVDDRYL